MDEREISEFADGILTGRVVNPVAEVRRRPELFSAVTGMTSFLPPGASLRERVYCVLNGMTERPVCPVCGVRFLKFDRKKNRYSFGCCRRCTFRTDEYRRGMLEKYGVESPNTSASVKERKRRAMLERYGVENPSGMAEVAERRRKTSIARYGRAGFNNREKAAETYMERTGYDNPSRNPTVKEKKRTACMASMGCDNPSKNRDVKAAKVKTCLGSNGVTYGYFLNRNVVYNRVSKLNRRFAAALTSGSIAFEPEFKLVGSDGSVRYYDFKIGENTLIELNGDFWHANPARYRADSELNFPHIGKIRAADIWARDAAKRKLAEDSGFSVFYVWESQLKKMSDAEITAYVAEKISRKP